MRGSTSEPTGSVAAGPAGSSTTVLLVGRSARMLRGVAALLSRSGCVVQTATSGRAVEDALADRLVDMVVLDFPLRDRDGLVELGNLKMAHPTRPVVLIGRTGRANDVVLGLRLGADDVIAWPADPGELRARLDAVLRRVRPAPTGSGCPDGHGVSGVDDLHIDHATGAAAVGRTPLNLTRTEFNILAALANGPDHVLSRKELVDAVWGGRSTPESRALDVHVARLRKKMQSTRPRAPTVVSVRLQGYRLAAADRGAGLLDDGDDTSLGASPS